MSTITTLLRFQVDNRDAKRKLDELRKKQGEVADDAEKHAKASDAHFKGQIEKWAKIAAGITAVIGIYKGLEAALERYAKVSQLRAATVSTDIGAIKRAAGGLLTEYQALQFAAAALNTDFKLNQREMEQVSRFMINLRNQGNDLTTVYNEVTKALVEGNTEGLKKFGIVVKAQAGSLEAHHKIMQRIAVENLAAGNNIERAGDSAMQAKVQWQDALDKLVEGLGNVATALAPIVKALAFVVDSVSQLLGVGDDNTAMAQELGLFKYSRSRAGGGPGDSFSPSAYLGQVFLRNAFSGTRQGESFLPGRAPNLFDDPLLKQYGLDRRRAEDRAFGNRVPTSGLGPVSLGAYDSRVASGLGTSSALGIGSGSGLLYGMGERPIPGGALNLLANQERGFGEQATDVLNQTQTFDAMVRGSQEAAMAIGTLQQVGVTAFTALASGADGFGSALRRTLTDGVVAMGSQLTAKAVYHGVWALGELAFGNVKDAAIHGATAGKAAAGAAALAVIARGMGAGQRGGAGGGGGYSGALPGAAAGAFGGGGVNTTTVYVVPTGLDDDPRSTRKRIADTMDRTGRENGGSSTVEYR